MGNPAGESCTLHFKFDATSFNIETSSLFDELLSCSVPLNLTAFQDPFWTVGKIDALPSWL
jgi:hypothetical protein